jgi:uncharacterized protein (DUF849 family)
MTARPNDDCESTTADLIDLVYGLQAALKTIAEMLAMGRNNPISPVAWDHLAIGAHYLKKDVSSHVH